MTRHSSHEVETLTSDKPKVNPDEDQFGYSRFALLVAKAILSTPSPQGLILAVHGAWGSGKSTLLNFVKHYLSLPENAADILLVDFNPWWFNDRNHLASQFLSRFSSALKQDPSFILKVGDTMSNYADALALASTTSVGQPWASKPIAWLLKKFAIKKKDIPELKEKLSKVLSQSDRRILFLIDDIDRLTPDEIKELFKVLKALADFPNVMYLLSFDREVVENALSSSLGVSGSAYLEKIVQVPFSLPSVDKSHLRTILFGRLDMLLGSCAKFQFDSDYWANIYFSGIDSYINKPRDIVRYTNALFVTYPAVAAEVNAVDFFALEILRIFESNVYETIRDNGDMFWGYRDQNRDQNDATRQFHDQWLSAVPDNRRESVKEMVSNIFPKVTSSWGGAGYGSDWAGEWRRELRVCSPDLFATYFQYGLPDGKLGRAELDSLVLSAAAGEPVGQRLLDATAIVRADGSTKAGELMERLRDLKDEIDTVAAKNLLIALLGNSSILLEATEADRGMFGVPAAWRYLWCVDHLLNRVPVEEREDFLCNVIVDVGDILGPLLLVDRIKSNMSNNEVDRDKALASFPSESAATLIALVVSRLNSLEVADFAAMPNLATLVYAWQRVDETADLKSQVGPVFLQPELLPKLLDNFKSVSRSQQFGKAAVKRTIRFDPKNIENFIDLEVLRPLVAAALSGDLLTSEQRQAAESLLRAGMGHTSDDSTEDL